MKVFSIFLALVLCLTIHAAADNSIPAAYDQILQNAARITDAEYCSSEWEAGEIGIREASAGKTRIQALESIGFSIQDISGDGVQNLVIGSIDSWDGNQALGTDIYAVYTIRENQPVLCFEGWARNRYMLLNDGTIENEGSTGAASSMWGIYDFSSDGTSLECLDFFFSSEKDGNSSEIGFYHNCTGKWEPSESEDMLMSEDAFWRLHDDAAEKAVRFEFTPLSEYAVEKGLAPSFLRGQWVTDFNGKPDVFTAVMQSANPEAEILFTPIGTVADFRLLSLYFVAIDKDGKMLFETSVLFQEDELTSERPLIAGITFFGSIPNVGISYRNSFDEKHNYTVEISGYDGSLIMQEF